MKGNVIDMLTKGKAMTNEYTAVLREATDDEIREAAARMYGKSECKRRLAVCEREMKRRGALNFEKGV